jgi:hypothetical protein
VPRDETSKAYSQFQATIGTAIKERLALADKRNKLNKQIEELDNVIASMRSLLKPLPQELPLVAEFAVAMVKNAGLTDAVRMVLQASDGYITITDIVEKLSSVSYPLGRLENPRAAIVVVLSRMVGGEVERKDIGKTEPAFRWIDAREGLSAKLAKQFMELKDKK